MVNPLARVVMKNVTKTNLTACEERKRKNYSQSFSEFASKTKTNDFKSKTLEENKEIKVERINQINLDSLTQQLKNGKVDRVKNEINNQNYKNQKIKFSDLTKNNYQNNVKEDKTNKRCSFDELVSNNKTSNLGNSEIVKDYIEDSDRNVISKLISGNIEANDNNVKGSTILNLSQAVNSLIKK